MFAEGGAVEAALEETGRHGRRETSGGGSCYGIQEGGRKLVIKEPCRPAGPGLERMRQLKREGLFKFRATKARDGKGRRLGGEARRGRSDV